MDRPDLNLPMETALDGTSVEVPPEYWSALQTAESSSIVRRSLARREAGGYFLPFLHRLIFVDPENRCLLDGDRRPDPALRRSLLELVVLVYLLSASESAEREEVVSARDLPAGHFFRGPHALPTGRLAERFGLDPAGFQRAGRALGGSSAEMGDVAFQLTPLPRVPLYFLLWEGDEEFPAEASILFDRSISDHLSPDAIWGLVNLVTDLLVSGEWSASGNA